ncbi:protein of unknown function [Agreia sp. COWG]|nr:protein of unknown function [Agreia sp. COWG]
MHRLPRLIVPQPLPAGASLSFLIPRCHWSSIARLKGRTVRLRVMGPSATGVVCDSLLNFTGRRVMFPT